MMPIFQKAVPLLEKIESAGYEAFFVGGCVRDYILGKEIVDVDIATSATPNEIKAIFPKTIDVGIEHGTVVVIWEKDTYEITTFRTDGEYIDFRRPSEVKFIRNLVEDLKRRDFTMNSIAMDKSGRIIDPFHGQMSIKEKKIVTVGNATNRFHEDALRMMRAVRFVSQLSFTIESGTLLALKENAYLLDKIAIERKTSEFDKLLKGKNNRYALKVLIDTGLYAYLPGLENSKAPLTHMVQYELEELSNIEIWSLMVYFIEVPKDHIESFLRKWKLPVKSIRTIKFILHWLIYRIQSEWTTETLYEATLETAIPVERLMNILSNKNISQSIPAITDNYNKLVIRSIGELAVSGKDLIAWEDKTGGPWVKEKLALIERAVLTGQVHNQKEVIKEWLERCNQN
jgi:tRNA nucleotidyltransferase (CCA-adding enzyme)